MADDLAAAEVSAEDVLFIANSGALYVPNTSTTLSVQKVWLDEDGNELSSPTVDQVEVKLWQQRTETNAVTVTVSWADLWGGTGSEEVQVADGSGLTIDTGIWGNSYSCTVNDGPEQTRNDHLLVIDCISGDTAIHLSVPYLPDEIEFSDYTEPYFVPIGDKILHDTVTLTAGGGWSHAWYDLPQTAEDGTPYFYTVEETAIPGFHVSYLPNNQNGIQTGELVITNQSNGYVLPETGGAGTIPYTAGGLALLALAGLMYSTLRRKGEDAP